MFDFRRSEIPVKIEEIYVRSASKLFKKSRPRSTIYLHIFEQAVKHSFSATSEKSFRCGPSDNCVHHDNRSTFNDISSVPAVTYLTNYPLRSVSSTIK